MFVNVNGTESDIKTITYGVPQGSLLGPRLFSIHVNDLPEFVKAGILLMFADDTTIYCIGNHVEEVVDKLSKALRELYDWCVRNQLTVHTDKTEAMILKANGFTGPLRPILFGDTIIKYVTHSKCLGITIDNRLNWIKQYEQIYKSYSAEVKELKRFRYLPKPVQELIYFRTIIPAITYCIAVWGTASAVYLEELETLHAKAAKIIHKIKVNCSDGDLLQRANWEPISYLYKRRIVSWMHHIYYETLPSPISNNFVKKSGRLSNPQQFVVPRYHKEIGRNSLRYRGVVLWNTIDSKLKSYDNLDTFKDKIKYFKNSVNQLSFRKESCLITNKAHDFYYF